MIKVEVTSEDLNVKSGISTKTGKPYEIREQIGWAYLFDAQGGKNPHPTSIRLQIETGDKPFKAGNYMLHPSSIFADRWGQLAIGRVKLAPVAQTVQAGKAA